MKEFRITQSVTNTETRSVNKYLNELERIRMVSVAEELALAEKVQQGDQAALQRLVVANLRFVVSIAKKYQGMGLPLADLINEGNLGLIHAAGKFDHTKGFKFITYAVWWIRRYMLLAVSQQKHLVRVPDNEVQLQSDLRNANAELQQKLHREPTTAELADHLCLSIEKVKDNIAHDTHLLSADRESGDEGSTPFIDMLPSDFPLPDAGLLQSTLCRDVESFVSTLPERERVLMELSYGLNGHLPLSMVDIAETLGMTREWTRKIRFKVLETLRQKLQHQYTYEDRNL